MRLLSHLLLLIGTGWVLLASLGVLRFDDVYARMHAVTKATTLGLWLVVLGTALSLGGVAAAKLILVGLLVFLTAPVGAHLVGRAVHRSPGSITVRIDTVDELEEAERRGGKA